MCFLQGEMHIFTNKPSKVLFALTKLLMTDEFTRTDGTYLSKTDVCYKELMQNDFFDSFF
jgi:hypothetical protein